MSTLHLYPLDDIDQMVYPETSNTLTLDSPALSVFTDFEHHTPLVIDADTRMVDAEKLMRKAHVRLKLVIDEQNRVVGLLASDQLAGEQPMKMAFRGLDRNQLTVAHLMQPRSTIQSLDFHELSRSTVRDVVATLQEKGVQHCLVVEHQHHQIRGVISAADIARRLHIDLPISQQATSFLDVFQVLHHH